MSKYPNPKLNIGNKNKYILFTRLLILDRYGKSKVKKGKKKGNFLRSLNVFRPVIYANWDWTLV